MVFKKREKTEVAVLNCWADDTALALAEKVTRRGWKVANFERGRTFHKEKMSDKPLCALSLLDIFSQSHCKMKVGK